MGLKSGFVFALASKPASRGAADLHCGCYNVISLSSSTLTAGCRGNIQRRGGKTVWYVCSAGRPAVSLLHTPRVKQRVTEGAAQCRVRVSCMGWDMFSIRDDSLAVILLSSTTSTESRGPPRTELAFFTSLSSFCLSAVKMLLPQQTTPKMADATTESKKVFRIALCTPKDSSYVVFGAQLRVCEK